MQDIHRQRSHVTSSGSEDLLQHQCRIANNPRSIYENTEGKLTSQGSGSSDGRLRGATYTGFQESTYVDFNGPRLHRRRDSDEPIDVTVSPVTLKGVDAGAPIRYLRVRLVS